jgi:hypothetical protein
LRGSASIGTSAAEVDADDNQATLLTLDSGPLFLAGELRIVGLQLHEETTVQPRGLAVRR